MNKKDKGAGKNTELPLKPDQKVQELRRQAERIVRQQDALPPVDVESLTLEKSQKLLQELQVHQVELAMQNEELRASRVELEESRLRYFKLYDLAPVGYLTVSEQGFITLANLTVATLLGVERSALDNTLFSLYILKEDQDIYYRYRIKLFESGEDQQCELRMVKDDGAEFWVKLQGNFVPGEDGGPFYRLTLSDITENKKAKDDLHESEEKYRFLAENIGNVAWTMDMEMNTTYVSPSSTLIFGFTPEERLQQRIDETMTPESFGLLMHRVQVEMAKEESGKRNPDDIIVIEAEFYHKNGGTVWMENHVKAAKNSNGELTGIYGSSRDITERKQAEEEIRTLNAELEQRVKERTIELEAVNKELESFAYSISHDFRAPLRALNAFSANLTEKYNEQLDEQGLHYLDRINKASLYMSDLVDDLLSLSRITRAELKKQGVDISHLSGEILTDLQDAEPERRVKVEIEPGLSAKGDLALLKAALENLIDNAWKFSSQEPQTLIEVGQTNIDGEKVFFVSDNGVGFNMAYADKLFGAFQRLHGADEFPGTGIGLATVQRIINRHGGRIWAESEVGKGAIFYFTLKN